MDTNVGDEEYEGTPGLWELIISKQPDGNVYSRDDFENYAKIMVDTSALKQNNPAEAVPKSSRGWKWKNLLRSIWKDKSQYEGQGIGTTVVIPSDPDDEDEEGVMHVGKIAHKYLSDYTLPNKTSTRLLEYTRIRWTNCIT